MDEFKYRLNHDDASIVANVCEKLYDVILGKLSKKKEEKIEELELLWQVMKKTEKPLTATSCAKLITKISLKSSALDPKDILSSFYTSASQTSCNDGICWSIGQILWNLEIKTRHFGIAKDQHPFVALLRASPQRNWPFIAAQLQSHFAENSRKALELHKAVYVYIFCDPNAHVHFSALRAVLVQDLLSVPNDLINHIIKWLPIEQCTNPAFQELVSLIVLPWIQHCHWEYSMPYLCSLALQTVQRGLDPRSVFNLIRKHEKLDDISLILLSEVLDKCTFDHMESILQIVSEKLSIMSLFSRLL